MRRPMSILGLAIATLGVGACSDLAGLQLAAGTARLEVHPRLVEGGYRLQGPVLPFTPRDVVHVEIRLSTLASGGETPTLTDGRPVVQDLAGTALAAPVTFAGLAPHTTYRLRARAFKERGDDPAGVISDEAASFLDVSLLADDRPAVATLSIHLKDVPFDGRASLPALEVLPGAVVPAGSESLQVGSPTSEEEG